MKLLALVFFALSFQFAHADQGDACAKTFVEFKSNWPYARLIQWCNTNEITEAHAEVASFFKTRTKNDWSIADLMLWAKKQSLTSAQVSCGILYYDLKSTTQPADLLLYCRNQGYTKKDVACARDKNPHSVARLTDVLDYCKKNR